MLHVQLQGDLEQRLGNFAAISKTPVDRLVNQALAEYLEEMEDLEEAKAILADPNTEYYTTEEMLAQIGLEEKDVQDFLDEQGN